jgi:hypothetical protein
MYKNGTRRIYSSDQLPFTQGTEIQRAVEERKEYNGLHFVIESTGIWPSQPHTAKYNRALKPAVGYI